MRVQTVLHVSSWLGLIWDEVVTHCNLFRLQHLCNRRIHCILHFGQHIYHLHKETGQKDNLMSRLINPFIQTTFINRKIKYFLCKCAIRSKTHHKYWYLHPTHQNSHWCHHTFSRLEYILFRIQCLHNRRTPRLCQLYSKYTRIPLLDYILRKVISKCKMTLCIWIIVLYTELPKIHLTFCIYKITWSRFWTSNRILVWPINAVFDAITYLIFWNAPT